MTKQTKAKLGGILPALVTPLNADMSVNTKALEALLARVYGAGVDGAYVCGSTGEGLYLPSEQRRQIAEIVLKNSPAGKTVIVHIGSWSTAESLALAKHAAKAGASAVSSLRPNGVSFDEVLGYYRTLGAAVDVPFLAYYFPSSATDSLSLDQLERICAVPGIAGLKFTDYNLYTLGELLRSGNVMFNGRDEVLAAGLLMGAHGGIGSIYNLTPKLFVELNRHAQAGRWAEAHQLQDTVNALIRALVAFPFMPALKRVLTWHGIECGEALAPRLPLTAEEERELRAAMAPFEELMRA